MRELKGDWRDLFGSFILALDLRKMFLALCLVVLLLTLIGIPIMYIGNYLDPDYVQKPTTLAPHNILKSIGQGLHVIFTGTKHYKTDWLTQIIVGAVIVIIFLFLWSRFGGAIARIAAYEVAKDERIETSKALRFSKDKLSAFFWAPLLCIIGFVFFYIVVALCGGLGWLLDHIRIGAPLVAIFLPLAILAGFIMLLIAIGSIASVILFKPAVGAEGTDSFDAVSRGFSYVFSKPWHYIWYQLVGNAYGVISIIWVLFIAFIMCMLAIQAGVLLFPDFDKVNDTVWSTILSDQHSRFSYKWDVESLVTKPHPYGRFMAVMHEIAKPVGFDWGNLRLDHQIALVITLAWVLITIGLAYGYIISYIISSQTIVYFLMRKKVDGIEMNEVYEEPEGEEEKIPSEVTVTPPRPETTPEVEKKE